MTSSYRVNYQLRAHRRDELIEFIKSLLLTPFVVHARQMQQGSDVLREAYAGIFESVAQLINGHIAHCAEGREQHSPLKELVPSVGFFFTPLDLLEAFKLYDTRTALSSRQFVAPSFNDVRHILNISQVLQIRRTGQLVTFDGDQTLYEDGGNFAQDSPLVSDLIDLINKGTRVALVTAAGYPGQPERYETRLSGLLAEMTSRGLDEEVAGRFYVVGGECNYLFRCAWKSAADGTRRCGLVEIAPSVWRHLQWTDDDARMLLDVAEKALRDGVGRMKLAVDVLRKPHAVGIVRRPHVILTREQLDELALSCKHALHAHGPALPFCAFNGGADVWVDIGNKLIGVQALQQYLGIAPKDTLHVGDQFLSIGNDVATRRGCCTAWVSNPKETCQLMDIFLCKQ